MLKAALPHISLSRSSTPVSSPLPSANGTELPITTEPQTVSESQATAVPPKVAALNGTLSGLGAIMAKRSVSATGLSRRASVERPASESGRSRSIAPVSRSNTTLGLGATPATESATTGRNFMSLLHPRASASLPPVPATTPPNGSPATANAALEASYVSKVTSKLAELVNRIFPATGGVVYKGRCSPIPERAKELGDYISAYVPSLNRFASGLTSVRTVNCINHRTTRISCEACCVQLYFAP